MTKSAHASPDPGREPPAEPLPRRQDCAPPIHRAPMRPRPWLGLRRGLLHGLRSALPGRREEAATPATPPAAGPAAGPAPRRPAAPAPRWQAAARRRRRVLLLGVAALAALAFAGPLATAPAEPGAAGWAYAALLALLFAWVGAGAATALMGAWVAWRGDPEALALPHPPRPIDARARTAIVMPICNEDIATVFGGLGATCESLAATGALSLFDVYVLSDTADPALRAAELRAWQRLRAITGDAPPGAGGRLFYRWRRRRTRRKAGNIADFCRRWGRDYRYMIVLDADSTMHGRTLVDLVRLMEAHPRAAIVQTLPQPCGHATLHARVQQFAARVSGRLQALGMAWWQLGDGHYWGHNAIIRLEPFMAHGALATLPGRGGLAGEILSHDFVEAALMGRAGHEVWLAPGLGGSWEQNPPHLLDELQRDRRWCQGNLQNARLIAEPGWRPAHRAMFATGAFAYAVAPLWLGFTVLGLLHAGAGAAPGFAAVLWWLTLVLLLLPRALGVAAVLLRGAQHEHGGTPRLLAGALVELGVSAWQAPLRMVAHSLFVAAALTGLALEWKSPARAADRLAWRDAWAGIGRPASWAAAAGLGALAWRRGEALLQQLPMLLPLLLAAPFTVFTGSRRIGAWADRHGPLWLPEQRRPPRPLARAAEHRGFAALAPASPAAASPAAGRRPPRRGRPRLALALAACAAAAAVVLPRVGVAPELSPRLRAERELAVLIRSAPRLAPPAEAELAPPRRQAAARPARRIDDALRRRAIEAVERALAEAAAAPA